MEKTTVMTKAQWNKIPHMTGTEEWITPELAKEFMKKNKSNRPVRSKHIKKFAVALERGDFERNPCSIAFDAEGNLIEGQHRLLAIIQTGIARPMMVTRNCPTACYHLDQPSTRSESDNICMHNTDLRWVNRTATALVRQLKNNFDVVLTTPEMIDFLRLNEKEILWTLANYKSMPAGLNSAANQAAIFIAYKNGVDPELLKTICKLFRNSDYTAANPTVTEKILSVKAYFQAMAIRLNRGGYTNKIRLYAMAQAISDIANDKPLSDLDLIQPFPFTVWDYEGQVVYQPDAAPHDTKNRIDTQQKGLSENSLA